MTLQFPQVQTRIAQRTAEALEKGIRGSLEIERVAIVFFNKVMAYNISVTGEYGDTLGAISKLSVSVYPADLLRGRITVTRLFIEDGCFNLVKEGPGKFNNINRIFDFAPKPDSLKKPLHVPDMTVDEVILRDMRFSLRNPAADTVPKNPSCINFKNLSLSEINARINRVRIVDDAISCRIRDLSCTDRCGYSIRSLSGNFSLDSSESRIDNLHLTDSYSEVNAGYLAFRYDSGRDLKDFIHKIDMGADFHSTVLDFRSIGVFAPGLNGKKLRINIEGEVNGPVCDLRTYDLSASTGNGTSVRVGAFITGLPKIDSTFFNVNLKQVRTTSEDLSRIISYFSADGMNTGRFFQDGELVLRGLAYGTLGSLYSIGEITYGHGRVNYEADMKGHGITPESMDLSVMADKLDIGSILSDNMFGDVSLNTRLSVTLPDKHSGRPLSLTLDSLSFNSLGLNGTDYRDIVIAGTLADNKADLRLLSRDPAFPVIFQGIADLGQKFRPDRLRLYMDVPYADLKAMNIIRKGTVSTAGFTLEADLRMAGNSILGNVFLDNIGYTDDNGHCHIDSLYIRSMLRENRHIITLMSPVLDIRYSSTDSPARLPERLKLALSTPSLRHILTVDTSVTDGNNGYYDFHLRTYDLSQICNIILPGLNIADSTTIDIHLDSSNLLSVKAGSSGVSMKNAKDKNTSFGNLRIEADNTGDRLTASVTSDRISSGAITVDNTRLILAGKDSGFDMKLDFNNADTTNVALSAGITLQRTPSGNIAADIALDTSSIMIRRHEWELDPAGIHIGKRLYTVDGFHLHSESDTLKVSGTVSENPDDLLAIRLANLDLSLLDSFTGKDLNMKGRLSGDIELSNFFNGLGATMEIEGNGLSLLGQDIGELSVLSRRDRTRERFNILINNYHDNLNPINASGYFIPERNYLNLNLALSGLDLTYLSPFLKDFLTISGGSISGDIGITGQPDRLILESGNSHIDSLLLTPTFTGVPYIINGPIILGQHQIGLQELTLTDPLGASATLRGSLSHNFFRDIHIDASLGFNNFMCLNTSERDNDKFYGSAFASGTLSLSGPLNGLLLDAQVSTNDRTAIHIPLTSSSSATTTDLISFTDFSKPADEEEIETQDEIGRKKSPANIEIRARANITQGAELLIEMNKQLGEILRCTGNGNLDVTLHPSRNITDLRGDYTISDGSYHFAMSIQSRDFLLNEGGTIAFNGDIKNTNLNVGATYRTKASISTLIADTTSVGNRRNVNCGIQLQGPLTNPELSFTIDIPDLDPITKGKVEGALSTPDKVQKQFMALLISGSFVPDEQSGIVNNSTILYSNASEILSNQFNNIFRQLDIPLDLGLNYQPGIATGGKDMFDVAISYQAFNNRLIINGNVGNSETSSNWAGDFDAEIKVDRQGKLRITLFTRSADSYSNYLDNTQRSGFGITYQDEFDTFGDFWRNIFYTRKRKEEYELMLFRMAEEELEREAAEANIQKEQVQQPKEDPMGLSDVNPERL